MTNDNNSYKNLLFDSKTKWNFNIDKSNTVWSVDITHIPNKTRDLFLFTIKDIADNYIVKHVLSETMPVNKVLMCLESAFKENNIKGNLIIHSDNGPQFTSNEYKHLCEANNVKISMSRKGFSIDNSPIENFFSMLKCELDINRLRNLTIDEIKYEVYQYCHFYNIERISTKLKGMTPFEYRYHSKNSFLFNCQV